jgi:hypothetical protein
MAAARVPRLKGRRFVWIARRFIGGVSMTDRSRTPASDICSVLGIGGRAHRERVDPGRHLLEALLVDDAEALLLVHDQQPEVLEDDVLGEQPMRADEDVDLPCATA